MLSYPAPDGIGIVVAVWVAPTLNVVGGGPPVSVPNVHTPLAESNVTQVVPAVVYWMILYWIPFGPLGAAPVSEKMTAIDWPDVTCERNAFAVLVGVSVPDEPAVSIETIGGVMSTANAV